MAALADLCRFIPTTAGTTDWVYSSVVGGCQSPTAANVQNGVKYKVYAVSSDLTQWEIAEGSYVASSGLFPRTTVLYNSSGSGTAAGQSGAGTRINFATVPQVAVVGLAEDVISVEVANSFTAAQRTQARANISAVLKGHLFGLTLSTAGSSASFGVAAGDAADGTGADLMALASAYTKTTGPWAVGSGNGALDSATIAASTWYHVYLIKRPDTGIVDVLISLSPTTPALPTNYTSFRRIGSMKTNPSSLWTLFYQYGDDFLWDVAVQDYGQQPGTTSQFLLTIPSVPSGVAVKAILSIGIAAPASSGEARGFILSANTNSPSPGTTTWNVGLLGSTNQQAYTSVTAVTNTSAQLRAQINNAAAFIYVGTIGWTDARGRLA